MDQIIDHLISIGDAEKAAEESFLSKYHKIMPRTMLRYAIEKFPPDERTRWMTR